MLRLTAPSCFRPRRRTWRAIVLFAGLLVLGSGVSRSGFATSPPTALVVPDEGGPPAVPGETPPVPGKRMPAFGPKVAPPPPANPPAPAVLAPPLKPEAVAEPTVAALAPEPPPARKPRSSFEVAVGALLLPQALWSLVSDLDQHPELRGVGIDAAWLQPLSATTGFALRLGMAIPDVPAANWYQTGTAAPGLYTQLEAMFVTMAVDFVRRIPLFRNLDWDLRAGVGLVVVAGDVTVTETLPTCAPEKRATCPHWRSVTRRAAPLLPVLPAVRATTGLGWTFGDRSRLGLDVGLRDDTLYVGAGVGLAL